MLMGACFDWLGCSHGPRLPWVLLASLGVVACCSRGLDGVEPPPDPVWPAPAAGGLLLGEQRLSLSPPPRPRKGVRYRDPLYGIDVVRVTDRGQDGYQDHGIKQEYARSDPENADGTRLVLRGTQASWYLYDARSFRLLRRLPLGRGGQEPEPRWDATDPGLLYHLSGMKLMSLHVERGQEGLIHDFAGAFPEGRYLTSGSEGDASLDRRYFCLMVKNADWRPLAVLVFDRKQRRIVGRMDRLPDTMNWVSMDMSGRHCVIGWDSRPIAAYGRNLGGGVSMPAGARGHADLALTAEGRDVLVFQDVKRDWIAMADLESGRQTDLVRIPFRVNTDIGLHFSGNAAQAPGWVLVSTYGAREPPPGRSHSWMDLQIFMVELRPQPRIWRIAATRSYTFIEPGEGEKAYFAEPFAAINTRGTRVYWGSNWGQSDLQRIDLYLAELPAQWPRRLPAAAKTPN